MASRPPIPQPPHHGGCLCGAVRYRLDAPPLAVNACHCKDCQKLTGATNLVAIIGPTAAFSADGPIQRWRKRADSGREVDVVRCTACGVRLWHEPQASPEYRFIAAGTLDTPGWAVPVTHIWVERALPAASIPADAVCFAGPPPNRDVLIAAFAEATR